MKSFTYLQADMKQIKREPIMMLFAFLSLLLIAVFKVLLTTIFPYIKEAFVFDVMPYYPYLVSLVYLLQPTMLGTIMGFFMLDEKDAHILELLRVTPLGLSGYLANRLVLPITLVVIYNVIAWFVLGSGVHGFVQLLWIILFTVLQTISVGLWIALVSEDKVKGLTNAKALSVVTVFGFIDLFNSPMASRLALITPQYYVTLACENTPLKLLVLGLLVNILWTLALVKWSTSHLGE